MNRTPKKLLAPLMILAALLMSACATSAPAVRGAPAIVLALQITGGGAPTAQQIATIEQMLAPAMGRDGLSFAKNPESADYLVSAVFAPDPVDPATGHLTVTGIDPDERSRVNLQEMRDNVMKAAGGLQNWGASHASPDR